MVRNSNEIQVVGFRRRLFAIFIDGAVLAAATFIMVIVLGLIWHLFFRRQGASSEQPASAANGDSEGAQDRSQRFSSDQAADPHSILGVPEGASQEDIRAAYRQLAAQYHPDKLAHLGEEFQVLAEKKFKAIQSAYDALRHRR